MQILPTSRHRSSSTSTDVVGDELGAEALRLRCACCPSGRGPSTPSREAREVLDLGRVHRRRRQSPSLRTPAGSALAARHRWLRCSGRPGADHDDVARLCHRGDGLHHEHEQVPGVQQRAKPTDCLSCSPVVMFRRWTLAPVGAHPEEPDIRRIDHELDQVSSYDPQAVCRLPKASGVEQGADFDLGQAMAAKFGIRAHLEASMDPGEGIAFLWSIRPLRRPSSADGCGMSKQVPMGIFVEPIRPWSAQVDRCTTVRAALRATDQLIRFFGTHAWVDQCTRPPQRGRGATSRPGPAPRRRAQEAGRSRRDHQPADRLPREPEVEQQRRERPGDVHRQPPAERRCDLLVEHPHEDDVCASDPEPSAIPNSSSAPGRRPCAAVAEPLEALLARPIVAPDTVPPPLVRRASRSSTQLAGPGRRSSASTCRAARPTPRASRRC